MAHNGPLSVKANIEYQIRKLERGIKIAHRGRLFLKESSIDYDSMVKKYVDDIKELRDKLEQLTEEKYFSSGRWKTLIKGSRRPSIPKWPL
jgi:hypothetical protein